MFVRNCLNAGDYVVPVPLGLPLTLKYGDNGVIQKVYLGYEDNGIDISQSMLKPLLENKTAPTTIPVKGGTTWVKGVLHTEDSFFAEGNLPEAIREDIILHYNKFPENFVFYAGNVESLATRFSGASVILNWLDMSGFKVLRGYLASAKLTRESFLQMLDHGRYAFNPMLVMYYMIYNKSGVRYVSTQLSQFTASRVVRLLDDAGNIKANIYGRQGESAEPLKVDMSDVITYNILTNTCVVIDRESRILVTMPTDNKKRDSRSRTLECSVCGKVIQSPVRGRVMCQDIHCMSRQYKTLCHFLTTLNLPIIDHDKYLSLCSSKRLTGIPDVFGLEEYSEVDLEVSLNTMLDALVPTNVVPDRSIISIFVNRCNQNIKTFQYYAEHPDKIGKDLQITSHSLSSLVRWFNDQYNLSDMYSVLQVPNLTVVQGDKKFDGAPIFTGKTIMITGRFRHGDTKDIIAILRSYSAEVVTQFSESVNYVLIGDILEDVDGGAISKAANRKIPTYSETAFFNAYEIDNDLLANL